MAEILGKWGGVVCLSLLCIASRHPLACLLALRHDGDCQGLVSSVYSSVFRVLATKLMSIFLLFLEVIKEKKQLHGWLVNNYLSR